MISKSQHIQMKKGVPTTDTYTDPNQHQNKRNTMFIQQEMMPIYLVLKDILEELKKLNAK
jgi:hypothetical protein